MKFVGYFAIFVGGAIACYLMLSLGLLDKWHVMPTPQEEPSVAIPTYLSFVSVMMTTVTVVLAALAIGIGIVAAYTFKDLQVQAKTAGEKVSRSVSEETATRVASEALSEVRVKAMVLELYAKAESERQQAVEWGEDPSENEER